jgi:hypothetical protein
LSLKISQGETSVSWDSLSDELKNVGAEQLNQNTFVSAYNNDSRLQDMVNSFNDEGLMLAGSEPAQSDEPEDDTVDNMAKSATKNALK